MTTINVSGIEIGANAFRNNKTIISVDCNYVAFVNNNMSHAFYWCNNIANVTNLNENVTDMYWAFASCYNLVNAPVIPNSVTSLSSTFYKCKSLVNAPVIPNSVTDMYWAFEGCTSLVNAPVIPNSVTDMNHTFDMCNNLVNLPTISNSVTDMNHTFYNCRKLTITPIVPDGVIEMNSTFKYCTNLTTFPIIPNGVNSLPDTFAYCNKINGDIIIPNSVTSLPNTFYNCNALTGNICIHSPEVINVNRCFMSTTNNKNVYIPMFTKESESYFGYCYNGESQGGPVAMFMASSDAIGDIGPGDPWGDSGTPITLYSTTLLDDRSSDATSTPKLYIKENSEFKKFPYKDLWACSDTEFAVEDYGYNTYIISRNQSGDEQIEIPVGSETTTYSTFKSEGYSNTTRKYGVLLFDVDSLS